MTEPKNKKRRFDSPNAEAVELLAEGKKSKVVSVLKKAAGEGNVVACFDLGWGLLRGVGSKSVKGGLEWLRKGAALAAKCDNAWKDLPSPFSSVTSLVLPSLFRAQSSSSRLPRSPTLLKRQPDL